MSLSTSVQKYQLLRIVDPDGTVDNDDKYAFLGITQGASYEITSAQKKQLLRLAVPDDTVTTSDKFAFLGFMEPQNPGGNIYEVFNIDWFIDTTLTGYELPTSNDGDFVVVLPVVRSSMPGSVENPTGAVTDGISRTLKVKMRKAYLKWDRRI